MKSIIKISALGILLMATMFHPKEIKAQDNSPLYFSNQPQAALYNPAFQTNSNWYLTLPGMSRFAIDIHTSGLAWSDLINKHPVYPDSLRMDVDGFLNKMKTHNSFEVGLNTDLLGFGFKVDKNYFSFHTSLNLETKLSLYEGLFDFLVNGTNMSRSNVSLLDRKLLDATAYMTMAFGYAREINEQLTVGGKLKFYSGIANAHTNKTIVDLMFDGEEIVARGDIDIMTSMAFGKLSTKKSTLMEDDSGVEFNDDFSMGKMFFKNFGMGFDIGMNYKINDKMEISASLVDIGRIKWKTDAVNIKSKNPNEKFTFNGMHTTYKTISDDFDDYFDDLKDSIIDAFDLEFKNVASYSTAVPTKLYVGYSWEFYQNMFLHALYNGRVINGSVTNSLSVNYTYKVGNIVQLSVGNTIRSKFFNPGAFISLGGIFYAGVNINRSLNVANTNGLSAYFGLNYSVPTKKVMPGPQTKLQNIEQSPETSFLEKY